MFYRISFLVFDLLILFHPHSLPSLLLSYLQVTPYLSDEKVILLPRGNKNVSSRYMSRLASEGEYVTDAQHSMVQPYGEHPA